MVAEITLFVLMEHNITTSKLSSHLTSKLWTGNLSVHCCNSASLDAVILTQIQDELAFAVNCGAPLWEHIKKKEN
jgi:hypothetical protein